MSGSDAGAAFEQSFPAITTMQLVKYAGASDDYNRIHYDQAFAQSAGLGGVIAHGMLTMGLMTSALTQWGGPRAFVRRVSARFLAPVRPGDVVRVEGRITASRETEAGHDVDCELVAKVGERSVATGEGTLRLTAARTA
ncbi:MAG TPA: MaoC/PaaZ C-terminal domain-containing protein [Casimicrobiaceae bacterium]|nr:MaoC/PaaZ C-terminal domain-containing protein [Casimicrobiaceae bacterium]